MLKKSFGVDGEMPDHNMLAGCPEESHEEVYVSRSLTAGMRRDGLESWQHVSFNVFKNLSKSFQKVTDTQTDSMRSLLIPVLLKLGAVRNIKPV